MINPEQFCATRTGTDRQVCEEMTEAFNDHCAEPVEPAALEILEDLLVKGVIEAVKTHSLPWDGFTQRFFVFAASALGRECSKAAAGGTVTRAMVLEAVKANDRCWRRVCPVPSTAADGQVKMGDCFSSGIINEAGLAE